MAFLDKAYINECTSKAFSRSFLMFEGFSSRNSLLLVKAFSTHVRQRRILIHIFGRYMMCVILLKSKVCAILYQSALLVNMCPISVDSRPSNLCSACFFLILLNYYLSTYTCLMKITMIISMNSLAF